MMATRWLLNEVGVNMQLTYFGGAKFERGWD